jgi:hypothetical protein
MTMSKYSPVYKCGLCGALCRAGNEAEVPADKLVDLVARVVRNQQFINNPALYQFPMHIAHNCTDVCGCGLATFVGFIGGGNS